ncbi:hypothetical protein [Halovivax limisalsi]|uniref:hypothetical protein n=1 Tax=Halovivax limisalsi TaxID=1453760 RepID=UPI001FFD7EDB|nr:hypothetical protein [Halovivax limisalsi]
MNRRNVLAGAGTALTAAVAGCLGTFGDSDPADGNSTSPNETDANGTDPGHSGDPQGSPAGSEEDGVPVLESFAVCEEATVPDAERESDMDPWGVFVASRDVATSYFEPDGEDTPDAVATFVEETAFDDGERLLFVQAWGPQTCYELQLGADPRVGGNGLTQVEFAVERTAPESRACGDAMTPVNLLLRLSYDPDGPDPDVVSASVGGDAASPAEFEIEADR